LQKKSFFDNVCGITGGCAAERNSFRAVKNQKIACDFLIFYRSLKFYLIPTEVGKAAVSTKIVKAGK
jgi:hypothetical protein